MTAGIPFSIYYGHDDIISILISSAISVISGIVLWFISRDADKHAAR
jgi:hypothetical protein